MSIATSPLTLFEQDLKPCKFARHSLVYGAQGQLKKDHIFKRTLGLGGSDIGALFGVSPYKTPLQLWREKMTPDAKFNHDALHLRFGQHLEPFIADEYERVTGLQTLEHSQAIYHPEHDFMYAHIDRLVVSPGQPAWCEGAINTDLLLECKTAHVFAKDEWGEVGTDQVPAHYLLQCIWYLAITKCQRIDVALLLGNQDFRIYHIKRDLDLEETVLQKAYHFWHEHVLKRIPPSAMNEEDIRSMYPQDTPGVSLEADESLMEILNRYKALQTKAQVLDDESDALKQEIMARMADAQQITHAGQTLVTWKCSKPSKKVDLKSLSAKFPELVEQFSSLTQASRRFIVKELV